MNDVEKRLYSAFENCASIHEDFRKAVNAFVDDKDGVASELAIYKDWVAELSEALCDARAVLDTDPDDEVPDMSDLYNNIERALRGPFA